MGVRRDHRIRAGAVALWLVLAGAAAADEMPVLSADDTVRWALERNPELATLRRQHGIAAAAVVIARTYPFNPIVQDFVLGTNGPLLAGVTNHVFNEHTMRLDLELRGQGRHRRAMAEAALSRTEWEIATQEAVMAVRALRAFNALLYRRQKLQLADEVVQFQQQTVTQVGQLVQQNRAGQADLLIARADLAEARTLRGPGRTTLDQAANDLRRVLGLVEEPFDVQGSLEVTPPQLDPAVLAEESLRRRPDVNALRLAVQEAEARLRLEIANRFGNPSMGPATEYNETRAYFVGLWCVWPIPVLNTRRGEIMQRRAERDRAAAAVQQSETQIRQDVQTALTRLADAQDLVNTFRTQTFPALREARDSIDRLFTQGAPGVDLARVMEVRRRVLRARDAYLDALWELSQARADLAAAVGEPSLGYAAAPAPAASPAAK
jgi:outer membrane protein TolC